MYGLLYASHRQFESERAHPSDYAGKTGITQDKRQPCLLGSLFVVICFQSHRLILLPQCCQLPEIMKRRGNAHGVTQGEGLTSHPGLINNFNDPAPGEFRGTRWKLGAGSKVGC